MKTLLGGWAGQVRNAEINLMNKALASSANTIGANQAILDIADKSQRQMEDIGRLTNLDRQGAKFDQQGNPVIGKDGNYVFEQGRQPTSADQNTIIRDYLQNHPLLSKAELDHYTDLLDAAEKGGGGVAQGSLIEEFTRCRSAPCGYRAVIGGTATGKGPQATATEAQGPAAT